MFMIQQEKKRILIYNGCVKLILQCMMAWPPSRYLRRRKEPLAGSGLAWQLFSRSWQVVEEHDWRGTHWLTPR